MIRQGRESPHFDVAAESWLKAEVAEHTVNPIARGPCFFVSLVTWMY